MIVAENDEICSKENAERVFDELGSTQKTIRFVKASDGLEADHDYFAFTSGNFVNALIGSIELDETDDIQAMGAIEVEMNAIANQVRLNKTTAIVLITAIVIVYCFLCIPLVVWCGITINKKYQV